MYATNFRFLLLVGFCTAFCAMPADARNRTYQIHYGAEIRPADGVAAVSIRVEQKRGELRALALKVDPARYRGFAGDGVVDVKGHEVRWAIPRSGGELRYLHVVDHRRPGAGYDARITSRWALLKADKLFPVVSTRKLGSAQARATFDLTGPPGWRFQSRYGRIRGPHAFDDPDRAFDRPTGWLALGHLVARREDIADRYLLVTSPTGQNFRQIELLAFLRWNLPSIVELLPMFPKRFLIVSGSRDMWRGGLSGAGSIYLHGDRPLISQNVTSPLLHELIHVGSRLSGKEGGDWIVEGLAEYYGIEVLRRSGTISDHRFERAMTRLTNWANKDDGCLSKTKSTGANTARAVLVLRDLEREIAKKSGGRKGLDDVFRKLAANRAPVTEASFGRVVEAVLKETSATLARLPRCQAPSRSDSSS